MINSKAAFAYSNLDVLKRLTMPLQDVYITVAIGIASIHFPRRYYCSQKA